MLTYYVFVGSVMGLWDGFVGLISQSIQMITVAVGVNEAIAIMLFTVLLRLLLSPVSTIAMINMARNKKAMNALKPELEKLNEKHKDSPGELTKKTMLLYKKHNIKLLDKTNVMNMLSQGVTGFGMFQAIQGLLFKSKFMWIASIAKPDALLAIIVGVITYLSMMLMPGSAEQANQLMFIIPAVISVLVLISFPSAIGLYMAVSGVFSALQSVFISKYLQHSDNVSSQV